MTSVQGSVHSTHEQSSKFDTSESRTSSLDVEISLVELGDELGELSEITVHFCKKRAEVSITPTWRGG